MGMKVFQNKIIFCVAHFLLLVLEIQKKLRWLRFFRNGENICYVFPRCCVIVVRIGTESTHSETVFLPMKDFLSTDYTQVHLVVLFDVFFKYL